MTTIGAEGWDRPIGRAVISGGVAGDHSVPGAISSGDNLISVRHVSADFVTNSDLTSEFTIDSANTINNAAGTDTTGDYLVVTWAESVV